MTDLAALAIKVDASEADTGAAKLDKLAASGASAEASVDKLGKTSAQAGAQVRTATQQAADMAAEAQRMAGAVNGSAAGMNKATGSGRQFAMQMSQVGQQVMAGTNVIQALAMQLPDIAVGMNMSGAASKGFAGFLGGPWGIAVTAAIGLIATFGMKLLDSEDATKKTEKASKSLAERLDILSNSYDVVIRATREYNKEQQEANALTLESAKAIELQTRANLAGAKARLASLQADLINSQYVSASKTGGREGNYGGVYASDQRIQTMQQEVSKMVVQAVKDITALEASLTNAQGNVAEEMAKLATDPKYAVEQRFKGLRNEAKGAITDVNSLAKRLGELNRQEQAELDKLNDARREANKLARDRPELQKVTGSEIAKALGTTITSGTRSAARNAAVDGAKNSYHLTGQAIDIPLTVGGRPLTKAGIRDALAPLGVEIKKLLGPGDKGHSDHFHIAFGLNRLRPDEVRRLQDDATEAAEKAAKAAREAWLREWSLLFDMQEAIAKSFGAPFLAQQDAEFQKFIDRVRKDVPDTAKPAQDGAEAYAHWNDELRGTIDLLDQIGGKASGLGDALSALYGFRTGDFSGVPGAGGALLSNVFTTRGDDGKRVLNDLGETFKKSLDNVFGGNGSFFKALQNATTGAAAAGIVGNGSAGGQIGGLVGGALGGGLGEKILGPALVKGISGGLGKALGPAAGPLGAIAGGIIGGLVGGLFKKNATGSVILSGSQVTGTSGNGQRAGQASDLGSSVIQALDKLSAILGVSATGAASVSIGMRNDQFKVDPTGAGRTKESDVLTFSNAADAVKAALRIQIEKGVFEGLSEGVKKFLLNGDLEQQLSKFANYKGALDAARQAEDPVNYQINELAKARASIMSIATEIGASAEEVAKLEKYYADQHVKIVEEAGAEALAAAKELASQRSALEIQIMELEGRSVEALAAARALELAEVDQTLRPLYERIYALQDEAAAAAEAKAKADERYGLDTRLLELMGATAILRERELAALDPANRALQETIWQLEDLQKVTSQSRDLDKRLARATGNTALADAMDQQDFLAQYGADLQEKALAVWNAEHKKVADTANKYSQMLADAAGRMGAANDNLASANDNLASSMAETLDKFRGFSDALRKFRDGLYTTAFDDARNFGGLRGQYSNTAMMARRGDETALAGLPDIAKQYLDAAKDRSSTREDYERIVESVLRDTGAAIRTSDAVADGLDYQRRAAEGIDKLNARVEALAAGQDDLREEIRTGNSDTRRTREVLEDVTDGDGIRLAS